ncbi:MAG: PQQ-dependent sugar dehydrogenase [Gammaproteobacteria bacterium]|nr:PQQ-dependent sugar dehydrogenase [Gammaproteobacteria bacterium]
MIRNPLSLSIILFIALILNACFNNNDNDGTLRSGLDARPDNQTCIAPDVLAAQPTNIALQPAFPDLPPLGLVLALKQPNGDNSSWYAVTQDGLVKQFANNTNASQATTFIDITNRVYYVANSELGLLGMAFHPQYATNGEIFLYYTANNPLRSVISRFVFNNGQWQEDVILEVGQPYSNHNGGNIIFGPDNYLYIGLGDGGSGGDPLGNGQNTTSLLGSILRIDVDDATPPTTYAIPADNPFAGNARCNNPTVGFNANDCPEIYAWGLRNPWRWSFDSDTGSLWLGDVGQGSIEEIDIIDKGGNYGWNIMEGDQCYNATTCDQSGLIPPVAVYSHINNNRSVVGGYVYRGKDPQLSVILQDTYLFADTYSSRIWGTKRVNSSYQTQELLNPTLQVVYSFAQDNEGELYVLDPAFGSTAPGVNIYHIVAGESSPTDPQPAAMLSETGCVDSTNPTQPAAGLIPYDLISPLWSDGARKQRFIALPNNATIDTTPDGDFQFPVGSILMKNFFLNDRIVETRLLMHHADGWRGYSYEWSYELDGTPIDAQLLTTSLSKSIEGQTWYYPAPGECLDCHTNGSNIALGPEIQQFNKEFVYPTTGRTANQIETLDAIGVFSSALTAEQKSLKLYALDDTRASYQQRAKSYLHSNCANCHQPNEVTTANIDLRFQTALADMNVCDAIPQRGNLGMSDPLIIDPNGTLDEPNSVLIARMESADSGVRMPPLASAILDSQAIELLKHWQVELTNCQ